MSGYLRGLAQRTIEGASLAEPLLGAPMPVAPHVLDGGADSTGVISEPPHTPPDAGAWSDAAPPRGLGAAEKVRAVSLPGADVSVRAMRPDHAADDRPGFRHDRRSQAVVPAVAAAPASPATPAVPASTATPAVPRSDRIDRGGRLPAEAAGSATPGSPEPGATPAELEVRESSRARSEPTRVDSARTPSPRDATRADHQPEPARRAPVRQTPPTSPPLRAMLPAQPPHRVDGQPLVPTSIDAEGLSTSPDRIGRGDPSRPASPLPQGPDVFSQQEADGSGRAVPWTPSSGSTAARAGAGPDQVTSPAEPTIEVTIGRIEIHGATPPARPARTRWSPHSMTLGDYLDRRARKGAG